MKLPDALTMREAAHGHGDKGMAFYQYEDTEGLGVVQDVRRATSRERFIGVFRFKWLPDRDFATFGELQAAVAELTDEAIAAEKAKWPQLREPARLRHERSSSGHCWTHKDQPATHTAHVWTCWIRGCGIIGILCAECAATTATDPMVVVRASEQRRADVKARHGDKWP